MSKIGKFLFLFSFLFFVGLMLGRLINGGWFDLLWAPLVLSTLFFVIAVVKERKLLLEFFLMRTTKHGMNMGVLILIAVVGLACVNFLAVRYERKFDWTVEKLHTLSDQSIKAAQALKQNTEILVLYRRDQQNQQNENVSKAVADLVALYTNVSKSIQYSSYNVLQRPDLAQKYEMHGGPFVVFAIQGDKKVRIEQPTEEEVTKALIKLGRENKKVIYFTMGHGEHSIEDQQPEGLSVLKQELSVTYDVKPLALFQVNNKVPDDAEAVAVVGPQQQFLDVEVNALRDYARRGGRLLLALDPGMKHNLAQLTKTLGVEFANNFVLDTRSEMLGVNAAMSLGTDFSKTHEITKSFTGMRFSAFYLASQLRRDPNAGAGLQYDELVQTFPGTVAIDELKPRISAVNANGPHAIGVWVAGTLPGSPATAASASTGKAEKQEKKSQDEKKPESAPAEESKEYAAAIFGDSDFLTNAHVDKNLNRDLALNSIAALMKDNDLISIRPKAPRGTRLELPPKALPALFWLGWLPVPILMFLAGGVVWWRRRTA